MKAFILSLSMALVATVALTSENVAEAKNGGGSGQFGGMKSFSHKGQSFYSHYYSHSYHGWSNYCWFPSYSCYGYYCPSQCCWYYYCPSQTCYLPTSYIQYYPPQAVNFNANQNQNQNQNTNTNVNINGGTPVIPTGGVAIPGGGGPPSGPGGAGVMPLAK